MRDVRGSELEKPTQTRNIVLPDFPLSCELLVLGADTSKNNPTNGLLRFEAAIYRNIPGLRLN